MPDISSKVIGLFDDLIARGEQIKDTCKKMYFAGAKKGIDAQTFEAWRTSCLTLLRSTFGTSSPHCDSFSNTKFFDYYNSTLLYLGILQGAREDLGHGYFYHKDLMLSVNIFNSFLSRAKQFAEMREMRKAAGLLESVVGEAMRKLAEARSLPVSQTDGLVYLADALLRAGVIPEDMHDSLVKLQDYMRDVDPARFEEWLAWVQKFLYEYLGSRIVIVN